MLKQRGADMEKLPQFIAYHWLLVSAFLIALITLFILETRNKGFNGNYRLSQQRVIHLINSEKAMVIDIRDVQAYNKGHITNAIHVSATELNEYPQRLEQYKQQPIVLVCTTGQKSKLLRYKLYRKGYKKAYTMIGGMNAWENSGIPVVKRNYD